MRHPRIVSRFLPALLLGGCAFTTPSNDFERIYRPTAAGTIEIKSLPPARQLVATGETDYFDDADTLFRRLFRNIRQTDVSMTVPVEGHLEMSAMAFYVGAKDLDKAAEKVEDVSIVETPQRFVASCGAKGSYTRPNIEKALSKLEEWLDLQTSYRRVGPPYAVFWDAPYVLWFMKRFEVHIPVERIEAAQ